VTDGQTDGHRVMA